MCYQTNILKQKEELMNKKELTADQKKTLENYPVYWRATLQKAMEQGESPEKVYKELSALDHLT